MSDKKTATPVELLTFELSDQEYSLDIMCVREIRGWTRATPLPHAPSYMKGVINLRGTVLPVMDLAERLGLPVRDKTERNVIIVVKHDDIMTGLLVDAVSDIIALTEEDLQPPPDSTSGQGPSVIKSLTLIDDRMIRVLDLSHIVNTLRSDAA
ncbi:chemotaxis protein CheW [uncultured Tateyamaria sp.]|uniref:chemotaxis protein CheW n=1 Tax=uncultured Tateyamaria sp. TaxID=455651 RepID=UPI002634884C|nr:chemotaxis protein CheW [uncultured Tateyamaria sp.]